ncbi:unnamed protein product [Medioppia subpectinata]|uniref:Uncharacterized protein n=1 Tax=Medioppia subpectinata TaxID=1979941 RepID=A0A7R9KRN1_9ACAR|nr:unnamed protein product [Medioppia subpectinata]CAG2108107.1 unnamed protein product [Medioppia subpectinata]
MEPTVIQYDYTTAEVIPRTKCFKFVKYSLIAALTILLSMALIVLIVAETKSKEKMFLSLGIISLVGVIVFVIGLLAIAKEHIPSVMIFAVIIIFYLLLFMYSRVLTSPGLIVFRTLVLLLLSIESLCFAIMIRDWRQLQQSRINAKYLSAANHQIYTTPYGHPLYGYQYYTSVPIQHNHNLAHI